MSEKLERYDEKGESLVKALKQKEKQEVKKVKSVLPKESKDFEENSKWREYREKLSKQDKILFDKALKLDRAKNDYLSYLQYCYKGFQCTKFAIFLTQILQNVVERIESNKRVRLLLSVPPRHGKSMICTKSLPSWFIGRNPTKHAIITAYNADLAEKFGDANRKKIKEFGKDIFNVEVSDSLDNKTEFELSKYGGSVMSVGILGGITGNGGELIIVDDPYKNGQDAESTIIRNQIEEVYRDSIASRVEGKGNAIIIIQTRWHEEDLCGVLSKEDEWIVVNVPAVWDSEQEDKQMHRSFGETLCPELGYDAEWAYKTKASVGEKKWESLYQGRPSIDSGNIFKKSTFNFYKKEDLPNSFEEITMSIDATFKDTKTSDFVAIQVWGRQGARHYLLKRIKKRLGFTATCRMIKILLSEYSKTKRILIEEKANGCSIIEVLSNQISGIVPISPTDSKVSRANAVTPYFDAGNIFFPSKEIDSNINDMIDEITKFPNSTHDDEVDAMTQYLNEISHKYYGKFDKNKTFITARAIISGGIKI